MGCNCGGNKNKVVAWRYVSPQGQQTTYDSKVKAQAAQIKNKGGRIVEVTK